ncbi:hypothetical protein [Leucobacter ruminantium]|uniref:5-bromo-4-chloroindolyl phosphate hydrolysis protein n=1 Tax=Leucobacter ruminantium TaxID=1289170 RepID=A0A939M0X9_9MICO|nr:hypothetical protein [Leucobacter ruminantium]MBO1806563.1 hypothetical protein [Leucobacter ruminantium]
MRWKERELQRVLRWLSVIGALGLIAVILWLDVTTGIWQDLVILSGLAGGLVTFLLTALVIERIVTRNAERKWEPVNRLATSDFLHAMADEEKSEIAHGVIVARSLPEFTGDGRSSAEELHDLRESVARERRALSDALGRWADFLLTSGENEAVLRHVAEIALQLDQVRDAALETENQPSAETLAKMNDEIRECNSRFSAIIDELTARLHTETVRR